MRRDAQRNRETVSQLLDATPPLDTAAICRRARLSLRAVQLIAAYLHRRLPRRRRIVKDAPLANVALVRRLVAKMGTAKAAAQLGVTRQAVYQRLARSAESGQ